MRSDHETEGLLASDKHGAPKGDWCGKWEPRIALVGAVFSVVAVVVGGVFLGDKVNELSLEVDRLQSDINDARVDLKILSKESDRIGEEIRKLDIDMIVKTIDSARTTAVESNSTLQLVRNELVSVERDLDKLKTETASDVEELLANVSAQADEMIESVDEQINTTIEVVKQRLSEADQSLISFLQRGNESIAELEVAVASVGNLSLRLNTTDEELHLVREGRLKMIRP